MTQHDTITAEVATLRAENARLREALDVICSSRWTNDPEGCMRSIARDALDAKP